MSAANHHRASASRWRSHVPALAALATALLASAAAQAGVVLTSDQQRRLGVEVQVLSAQRSSITINAFAKVLDNAPLAQLESDLESAEAAAKASQSEAARSEALYRSNNGVSAKDFEAAEAQARSDQSKLTLLRLRLGLEWGPGIAKMTQAQRKALIHALSEGRAALVQLDTPDDEGQQGVRSAEIDIADTTVNAVILGRSRNAEPRLQSSGLIAVVTGPQAILFSIGLTQSARLAKPGQGLGVVLPRSAIVRFQGSNWAYVRSGSGGFDRRLVLNPAPQGGGYFVAQGFQPGEAVAIKGVAALFAAERAPPQIPRSR
jgi:hypothetical protein